MRINAVNDAPIATKGDYVLYWMIANRRTHWNHALDHAIARAKELGVPLLVLEPLRCGYEWASERMHAFVIAGSVELLQGLLLPARSATFVDVVANTLGGLGGAAVVAVWHRWRRWQRRQSAA